MKGPNNERFRFGQFEADVRSGQLRKNGQILRLQDQPFQLLVALLQHAGEVVSREELRARLWPQESFGDFDQGLNTAINKLRETLGDSAASPRFIETLPKRGYRFTYPLEEESKPSADDAAPAAPGEQRTPGVSKLIAASAAALAIAAFLLGWALRPAAEPQIPLRKFTVRVPLLNYSTPDAQLVAISPNGRHIALVADEGPSKLWIQDLDRHQPRVVEGSEGALAPFWSPDSQTIGFVASGKVKKVSVNGGPVIAICQSPSGTYISGGSWSPDGGLIAFTAGAPTALYTVAATGGTARLVMSPQRLADGRGEGGPPSRGSAWISQPHFPPGQRGLKLLFTYSAGVPRLVLYDLNTGEHRILGSGTDPAWSPSGHLLYRSGNHLWARPFSFADTQFSGEAFQVARDAADPFVANDGTLVYRDVVAEQLVWLNRSGSRIGVVGHPADGIYYPALSPDGRRVAAEVLENGNQDIWVSDVPRETRMRLTSHLGLEVLPVWSPAAGEIAFSAYREENADIFLRSADAGSPEKRLTLATQNERVSDWSQDGQYVVYSLLHPKNGSDLWYLKRNGESKWESYPFLQTAFSENAPKLSPDGRYLAYLSNDSGRDEVYVRQFPAGDRVWPVSSRGAAQIRWSRSGRELYYVEAGALIAVSVRTVPEFEAGTATRLFAHPAFRVWIDANYDVSADGKQIILPERIAAREPMIQVVQNWAAEFRDRR